MKPPDASPAWYARIPDVRRTATTTHFVGGQAVRDIASLMIVQIDGDPGHYLIYLDSAGMEVTDTWHESAERAMAQAEFEFGVREGEWRRCPRDAPSETDRKSTTSDSHPDPPTHTS